MDEFLHVAIGAIATSYFRVYRDELMAGAEIGWVIQEGLAPRIPLRAADVAVGHAYVSATERARLGGDFLEVFPLDAQRFAFVLGDSSGHGLAAVADAVKIRSLFRGLMRENPDLTGVMARLNRILPPELEPEHFATVLAGIYGPPGRLELVNAGSPPPLLCRDGCALIEPGGLPLAVLDDATYTCTVLDLAPGDLFVAYTDGLIEARAGNAFFGEDRVREELAGQVGAPAAGVARHLLGRALDHARGQATDDITILALRRDDGTPG